MKSPDIVFLERLRTLIPEGQARLVAERAGMSEQTLSKWRTGDIKPNPQLETLRKLAAALRVPIEHLISDEGGQEAGEVEQAGEAYATVRMLAEVSAGVPRFVPMDQDPESPRLAFRRKWLEQLVGPDLSTKSVFVARVRGDSMSPTIRSGDTILVRRWWPPTPERPRETILEDGRVYLICDPDPDGGLTVKRLAMFGPMILVYGDNPAFRPYSIDLENHPLHRIVLGEVVWLGRREIDPPTGRPPSPWESDRLEVAGPRRLRPKEE